MLTISLEDMKFYAGHGIYPEEKILGNALTVDVSVSIEEPDPIDHIVQTVDYEKLYEIICEEMSPPTPLLETLAGSCVNHIKQVFPLARIVEVKISKLHPPVGGEIGKSKVALRKTFEA